MALTIARLPNEPIIIINLALPLDQHLDDLARIEVEVQRIHAECGDMVYAIVTIGDQELAYSDIHLFIGEEYNELSGSVFDTHVYRIIVNTNPLIESGMDRLHRTMGIRMPLVDSVTEGIAHARAQIAANTPPAADTHPPSA